MVEPNKKQDKKQGGDSDSDDNKYQYKSKFHELRSTIDPVTFKKWEKFIRDMLQEDDTHYWQIKDPKQPEYLKYIAGVDISFSKDDPEIAVSCIVVLEYPNLKLVYQDCEVVKLDMEYVPGFLAFREAAHLLRLFKKLVYDRPDLRPQVLMTDGNGILHTNACGLASHLGVLIGIPTIGIGKTIFFVDGLRKDYVLQKFDEQCHNKGDYYEMQGLSGRIWGAALQATQNSKDPIIISVGHKISLRTAVDLVKQCCKYRVPEPVRLADQISRKQVKKLKIDQILNAAENKLPFLSVQEEQRSRSREKKQKKDRKHKSTKEHKEHKKEKKPKDKNNDKFSKDMVYKGEEEKINSEQVENYKYSQEMQPQSLKDVVLPFTREEEKPPKNPPKIPFIPKKPVVQAPSYKGISSLNPIMIEIIVNDRLGHKERIKCRTDDTIQIIKKLIQAKTGTRWEKIKLQRQHVILKDHITLDDYEIKDSMCLEMYYN